MKGARETADRAIARIAVMLLAVAERVKRIRVDAGASLGGLVAHGKQNLEGASHFLAVRATCGSGNASDASEIARKIEVLGKKK